MRIDGVLYIARDDYQWVTPADIRRMCRSRKHASRYFSIRGGANATGGWQTFDESFKVDDMESARYLSWYYNLLTRLYLDNFTTDQVQEILDSDPTLYLPRDFYEATGQPKNPALVLVHQGARSIIGAHAKITEERIDWRLEQRYASLFNRVMALTVAYITLFENKGGDFYVGWVWKDWKISSWKDLRKVFKPTRAWFAWGYSPGTKTIRCWPFFAEMLKKNNDLDIRMSYDTNIYVPSHKRHVKDNRLIPEALRASRKPIVLNPVERFKKRRAKKATWFS